MNNTTGANSNGPSRLGTSKIILAVIIIIAILAVILMISLTGQKSGNALRSEDAETISAEDEDTTVDVPIVIDNSEMNGDKLASGVGEDNVVLHDDRIPGNLIATNKADIGGAVYFYTSHRNEHKSYGEGLFPSSYDPDKVSVSWDVEIIDVRIKDTATGLWIARKNFDAGAPGAIIVSNEEKSKSLDKTSRVKPEEISEWIQDVWGKYLLSGKTTKYDQELLFVDPGDTILFGTYEQDNERSNGKEEIEWIVLETQEDRILVLSKFGLDAKPYNIGKISVTWETCSLRKWLNKDFFREAFNEDEQKQILTMTVPADENPEFSTDPGNATQDQVFLFSIVEMQENKYLSVIPSECLPTQYAVKQGSRVNENGDCSHWWLRSPGYHRDYAARIIDNRIIAESGVRVDSKDCSVRPAMWISLEINE